MGTNYYAHLPPCNECGHEDELHIGKSSKGWYFALRPLPERFLIGPRDTSDGDVYLIEWIQFLVMKRKTVVIKDEYGTTLDLQTLLQYIMDRSNVNPPNWPDKFLASNHAIPGHNNLVRARLDGDCIAHGSGTWDVIGREFS